VIIYNGPSLLDGAPIVVIVTGYAARSTNKKTGAMVQTYIIRSDMSPVEAVRSGADASICGDCKHRGDGTGGARSCYVTLIHGPSAVWRTFARGGYPVASPHVAADLCAGQMIRLGTYGDPAAVPKDVWDTLISRAEGFTGYTHAWRRIDPAWASLVMASADTTAEAVQARAMGYRTFRVGLEPVAGLEINCPASEESGRKVQCVACKACMGTSGKARVSIQIQAHGTGKRFASLVAA